MFFAVPANTRIATRASSPPYPLLCLSINRAIYLPLTLELNRATKYWLPGASRVHSLSPPPPYSRFNFSKVFHPLSPKKLFSPQRNEENNTTDRSTDRQISTINGLSSPFLIFSPARFISQLIRPTSPHGRRMKLANV